MRWNTKTWCCLRCHENVLQCRTTMKIREHPKIRMVQYNCKFVVSLWNMVSQFQGRTLPTIVWKAVKVQYCCNCCQLLRSVPDVSLRNNGCVAFAGRGESSGHFFLWSLWKWDRNGSESCLMTIVCSAVLKFRFPLPLFWLTCCLYGDWNDRANWNLNKHTFYKTWIIIQKMWFPGYKRIDQFHWLRMYHQVRT
jgi:hypothetical protein